MTTPAMASGRRPATKLAIAAGILLMAGGLIGLSLTYRAMKLARHLHDKLAGVRIELAQASPEAAEPFTTLRGGLHTVHLVTLVSQRPRAGTAAFSGTVEYGITDTVGRVRYLGRIFPGSLQGLVTDSTTIVTLDTVFIPEAGAPLRLTARVIAPDPAFAQTVSELFLMPPEDPAFGDDLRRQSMIMAGMGAVVVLGFCIIVFGGRARPSPPPAQAG